MINKDRIVPVQQTDLLTLYGTIMGIANVSVEKLAAKAIATFEVATNSKTYLAAEPVKTLDFASGVTAGTVYFVAAYDFQGITIAGAAVSGVEVDANVATLYKAVLESGAVTVTKIGF